MYGCDVQIFGIIFQCKIYLRREIFYVQAHKHETFKQITKNKVGLNTWYTISGVHNTNQIQTLTKLIRYESC